MKKLHEDDTLVVRRHSCHTRYFKCWANGQELKAKVEAGEISTPYLDPLPQGRLVVFEAYTEGGKTAICSMLLRSGFGSNKHHYLIPLEDLKVLD